MEHMAKVERRQKMVQTHAGGERKRGGRRVVARLHAWIPEHVNYADRVPSTEEGKG